MVLDEPPITTLEELQNICALGLSVFLADPTRMIVQEWTNPSIRRGFKGRKLDAPGYGNLYLAWLGIEDESFDPSMSYEDGLRIFQSEDAGHAYNRDIQSGRITFT